MAVEAKSRGVLCIEEYDFKRASFEGNILFGPLQSYKKSSYCDMYY